jgi:hypothetical protein
MAESAADSAFDGRRPRPPVGDIREYPRWRANHVGEASQPALSEAADTIVQG